MATPDGGLPDDERLASVVKATRRILEERGWLDEADLDGLADRDIDWQQIYEIIAFVGLKTISNYVNHIAGTEIDPQFA